MRKRRVKPRTMALTPRSERLVMRVACAMAFESLNFEDQQAIRSKARDIIARLEQVQP